jgi:hypothetical protein
MVRTLISRSCLLDRPASWASSGSSSESTAVRLVLNLSRNSRDSHLISIPLAYAVVDTHPSSLASLRIDCPFDELVAHAESVDFAKLDSMEHGNVPFVIILVRALSEWKKAVRARTPPAATDLVASAISTDMRALPLAVHSATVSSPNGRARATPRPSF